MAGIWEAATSAAGRAQEGARQYAIPLAGAGLGLAGLFGAPYLGPIAPALAALSGGAGAGMLYDRLQRSGVGPGLLGTSASPEVEALFNAIRGRPPEAAAAGPAPAVEAPRLHEIPRKALKNIRDQVNVTLGLAAGEGQPLTQAISDEDRARLTALRDLLNDHVDGDPEEIIDFSAHSEVFNQGLTSAARVVQQNSPALAGTIHSVLALIDNAQRAANPHCRNAHTLLATLLRTNTPLSDEQRVQLRETLEYICANPAVTEGSGVPLARIQELHDSLEEGAPFDRDLARRAYADINRVIEIQSGEIQRVVLTIQNALLDPDSGILRNALDATLGPGGLADQLVADAPPSMVALNDSIVALLKAPVHRTQVSKAYFNILRFHFSSTAPSYLGRRLSGEEQGAVDATIHSLGLPAFQNRPKKRELNALRESLQTVREYAEDPANPLRGCRRDDFIRTLGAYEALPALYGDEIDLETCVEIPANHQARLRTIAQYLVITNINNPRVPQIRDALRKLERITQSEDTIHLSEEAKTRVRRLGDHVHTAMVSRSGRVYTMFHDLKRELLHPDLGLLPGIMRDYFKEVGKDAVRTISSLERIERGSRSIEDFRDAYNRTLGLSLSFVDVMHREPSEEEVNQLRELLAILNQAIRNGEYENFAVSPNHTRLFEIKRTLSATISAEQGTIQRQIIGLVDQVENLLNETLGRVDRFIRFLPADNPLVQTKSALVRLKASIEGNADAFFQRDKAALLRAITGITSQARNPARLEQIFGRPVAECSGTLAQLRILKDFVTGMERVPAEDERAEVLETIERLNGQIKAAMHAHPQYGEAHRAVDTFVDVAARGTDDAVAVAQRRMGGLLSGFGIGGAAAGAAEEAPAPARTYRDDPSFQCMQSVITRCDEAIPDERKRGLIIESIGRFDRDVARGVLQRVGESEGHDEAWARANLTGAHRENILRALSEELHAKIRDRSEARRRIFYLHIYENAPVKPEFETREEKIRWGQENVQASPVRTITAYAVAVTSTRRDAARAAAGEVPQAPPRREAGEHRPEATTTAGIGAVCGGLFSGALHFIQNAPNVMAQFSLDAFAGFIQHHLDTTILQFVQEYRDINPAHRAAIVQAVRAGSERLEAARVGGTTEGYQTALREVAGNLSRYDILINGTALVPAFGEVYKPEQLREAEERRIADAERLSPDRLPEQENPVDRVNEQKEVFKDLVSMYTTYMYVMSTRVGEKNGSQEVLDRIHREIRADVDFMQDNPVGSRGYNRRFDHMRAERIGEFVRAEEDSTLENVMRELSNIRNPEDRPKEFKRIICEKIDARTDISWPFKIWMKWVTIPLCMTFIPFFVGRTIDNFLWKVRALIHNATEREDGSPVTVINTKVINEITGFFAKYRKGLDVFAENEIGERRDDTLARFLTQKNQNNGWGEDETYQELGNQLVGKFFADTSIEEGPGKAAAWAWDFATTLPFPATPLGIIGNSIVAIPKFLIGAVGTILSGIVYGGAVGVQAIWNSASRSVMGSIVMNTQLIQQLSDTASNSLYNEAYTSTLNRILLRQLKELWNLLRVIEKDSATEKELMLVPRIVDNPQAPRSEALDHLDTSWAHLKTKLRDDDPRIDDYDERFGALRARLTMNPDGEDLAAFNQELKDFGTTLWRVASEFKTESLADKYPDRTKQAVSELIQHAIVVLDKRKHLDPVDAREDGVLDSIKNSARSMFLDNAVDSISGLLLAACETLLKKDFLETQLAEALEASNNTMLYVDTTSREERRLANHETEQLVNHYVDMIIRSAVNSTIDNAVGSLRDGKVQSAKEMIDWIKIVFRDEIGLRCKTPTPRKNIVAEWETLLRDYQGSGDISKINEAHKLLRYTLTELRIKGRELELNKSMSAQMKQHVGEARDRLTTSLHRFQDSLRPLVRRARSENVSREVETHTTSMASAFERARAQLRAINGDQLLEITAGELDEMRAHASVVTAAMGQVENPDPTLQTRLQRVREQATAITTFSSRIEKHQKQVQTLTNLRALVDSYANARRRGLVEEGRADGIGAVVAPVAGGNAEANRLRPEIERELEQLRDVPFDVEALKNEYRALLAAKTAENVQVQRAAFVDHITRSIDADKAFVLQERNRVSTGLENAARSLHNYNRRLQDDRGGDGAVPVEDLIARTREALQGVATTADEITYPPVLNVDLVDLSPGSMSSEWIKGFVYSELEKRAKQAVKLTQDKTVFNGALHHAAGAVVRALADPDEVRRRNQSVVGR